MEKKKFFGLLKRFGPKTSQMFSFLAFQKDVTSLIINILTLPNNCRTFFL